MIWIGFATSWGYLVSRYPLLGRSNIFARQNNPKARCLDCDVEAECPYSAKKIYLGRLAKGQTGWPTNVLTPDVTEANVMDALQNGPYGRCVYACDNDVVDNQVVNMLFEGGRTASFTMTAFNAAGHRKTHIFGTRGSLYGDGTRITRFDFLSDQTESSIHHRPMLQFWAAMVAAITGSCIALLRPCRRVILPKFFRAQMSRSKHTGWYLRQNVPGKNTVWLIYKRGLE